MKWFLLIAICFLASCHIERKIYSPLPVNNPSVQKKNDFSVNATISEPKGFDMNGGFAITNHMAIIAGAYTHKNKDREEKHGFTNQYDSSNLLYRHNGFTIGAGAFFPVFGKQSRSYLSFYSGINSGSFKMNEEFYRISPVPSASPMVNAYKSRLHRYFLQGSLSYYGDQVEASLNTRYNLVEYKKVTTDYTDNQLTEYQLPPFVSRRFNSFIDFSVDLKVFFSRNPRWGLQLFSLVSMRTNKYEFTGANRFYYYYPFRAGTGIFFRGFSGKSNGK
jgi:hypothetical protein